MTDKWHRVRPYLDLIMKPMKYPMNNNSHGVLWDLGVQHGHDEIKEEIDAYFTKTANMTRKPVIFISRESAERIASQAKEMFPDMRIKYVSCHSRGELQGYKILVSLYKRKSFWITEDMIKTKDEVDG